MGRNSRNEKKNVAEELWTELSPMFISLQEQNSRGIVMRTTVKVNAGIMMVVIGFLC